MNLFSFGFASFFAIFILLFGLMKGRCRVHLIAIASCFFYACWDWRLLVVLVGMAIACYLLALKRKITLGVVICLFALGVFKYFNFFTDSAVMVLNLLGVNCSRLTTCVILPMGISFYTFRGISYLIDIGRNKIAAEKRFIDFFAYFAFFPQLLAGPIVRAEEFIPQMNCLCDKASRMKLEDVMFGIMMFAWGAVLKIAMADSLAFVVDSRFSSWETCSNLNALVGVLGYSWQIYGDFCGYSLMSLGVARIIGFKFGANFLRPYFSASFQEFWRRWHISLSTWLRDYLYITLGGNRNGHTRRNLFVTMVLGGLWHGASWTFVAWGAIHGALLCIERLYLKKTSSKVWYKLPSKLLTFAIISIVWVFFRSSSFQQAIVMIKKAISATYIYDGAVIGVFSVVRCALIVFIVFIGDFIAEHVDLKKFIAKHITLSGLFCALCVAIIMFFGTFSGNSFIYQQF